MEDDEEEKQEIWSWGAGTDGQLGTCKLQDEEFPQLLHLPSLSSAGPISKLACGGAHVIVLTSGTTDLFPLFNYILYLGFLEKYIQVLYLGFR